MQQAVARVDADDFGWAWFLSVGHALRWAEEASSRPDYRGMFHLFGMPRGSVSAGGPGNAEIRELASTITLAARTLARPEAANTFLLAELSGPAVRQALAAVTLALREHIEAYPRAHKLTKRQVFVFAMVSARDFRYWQQNGRHRRLAKAEYARKLKLSRSTLHTAPWLELSAEAQDRLWQWHDEGQAALAEKLRELGVL